MPRYEFRCRACGDTFLVTRSMDHSRDPATCPAGHDDTVRLLTFAAVGGTAAGASVAGGRDSAPPTSGGGGCCGGGCCAH
ncbi:MAG: zinc ribbon domain-containing protein [Actinomycetales bacterium]|nr:zinc ribbon domain-containing protein [Actinomycetales bacterium]